jgi:hypothetical protein
METFKKYLGLLDLPSGVVLGLFTLIFIGMCVSAFASGKDIPPTVVDGWKFAVGVFAGSKSIQTVWGKHKQEDKPQ